MEEHDGLLIDLLAGTFKVFYLVNMYIPFIFSWTFLLVFFLGFFFPGFFLVFLFFFFFGHYFGFSFWRFWVLFLFFLTWDSRMDKKAKSTFFLLPNFTTYYFLWTFFTFLPTK